MQSSNSGSRFPNGSWSDALGLLQSGVVDAWAAHAMMVVERHADFLYTTPFVMAKYADLMKQQNAQFHIDINLVTAGIEWDENGIQFALLLFLFLVSFLSERIYV